MLVVFLLKQKKIKIFFYAQRKTLLKILYDAKVDIHATNKSGQTALEWSGKRGDIELCNFFEKEILACKK